MAVNAAYILRDIPGPLWQAFKVKAAEEGIPMRTLLLQLVTAYVEGRVTIGARTEPKAGKWVERYDRSEITGIREGR